MTKRISIPGNIRYAFTVMLLLLGLNFLLRVAFLVYNTAQAQAMEMREILVAFLMGVRFDISTILIVNGILFLFLLAPLKIHRNRITYKVLNVLILILNLPVLLLNGIDVVYFGFSERRLTHELYTTKGDLLNVSPLEYLEFWPVLLMFGFGVLVFYLLLNSVSKRNMEEPAQGKSVLRPRAWVLPVLAGLLIATGIRGGLQRPLKPGKAFVTSNHFAGFLSLNSAYTVITSLFTMRADKPVEYVDPDLALETVRESVQNEFDGPFVSEDYPLVRKTQFGEPEKRYNVVVLILESFNASNVGILNEASLENSITPNFDTLASHGLLFTDYHANGNRSVEAMPAILNSIPELYGRPTLGSNQEKNHHWGIGNMLQARGYHTSFFHGGHNGSMGFDRYSQTCGLDQYYGLNEYSNSEADFDGNWGIYDGPFMQEMADEMGRFPSPFLNVYFSVSNHHPFKLPDEGYEHIKSRTDLTPFQQTTMYADEAVGSFFQTASQSEWYDNTIFVITADHCNHEGSDPDKMILDYSHVPMLIIGPGIEPGVDDRPANHIDLEPTLIDLLKLETYHASTGVSLLRPNADRRVLTEQGMITLVKDNYALSSGLATPKCFHHAKGENGWRGSGSYPCMGREVAEDMELELKSFYQVIRNLRISNQLIGPEFMVVPNHSNPSVNPHSEP